jgi:CheY-like chemotaxis protein
MNIEKTRVLVIDDDADLRELIRDSLEREGFEVASAANGAQGLEAQRGKPAGVGCGEILQQAVRAAGVVCCGTRTGPRPGRLRFLS